TTPLFPLGDELPVLIEHLNTAVASIGNEQSSLRVEDEAMRSVEIARPRSFLAPRLDEFSVLVELDDARVAVAAVTVSHEYVAVRPDEYIGRPIEHLRAVPGDTSLAECHQDTPRRTDFEDLLPLAIFRLAVSDPDVVVRVDEQAVGIDKHAHAEARHKPP